MRRSFFISLAFLTLSSSFFSSSCFSSNSSRAFLSCQSISRSSLNLSLKDSISLLNSSALSTASSIFEAISSSESSLSDNNSCFVGAEKTPVEVLADFAPFTPSLSQTSIQYSTVSPATSSRSCISQTKNRLSFFPRGLSRMV